MSRYFPLFINLEHKKATVVGAGRIASRRIHTLLEFGADITVIAPEASAEVRQLAEEGKLVWIQEAYRPGIRGLFEGTLLALAATDDREVNQEVRKECRTLGIPVNLASDKEQCDFYFPGIASGGGVTAGITAEGKDHRLAKEATAEVRKLLVEMAERSKRTERTEKTEKTERTERTEREEVQS